MYQVSEKMLVDPKGEKLLEPPEGGDPTLEASNPKIIN